jgi:hypothetical protein
MRHRVCGAPLTCRRQPLTPDPDEIIVEMIPYCTVCQVDVPVEELVEDA